MNNSSNMPPEFREYLGTFMGGAFQVVFGFIIILVFGAMFSTLGGLLGASIFKKKPVHGSAQDLP